MHCVMVKEWDERRAEQLEVMTTTAHVVEAGVDELKASMPSLSLSLLSLSPLLLFSTERVGLTHWVYRLLPHRLTAELSAQSTVRGMRYAFQVEYESLFERWRPREL
jgi:hypothetical protein